MESSSRRDMLISALAGGALACAVPALSGETRRAPPSSGGTLRARAQAKGLLVGSAISAPELKSDARMRAVLKADCNVLTPENELKWSRIQPSPDAPLDFSQAEEIYAFALANDMAMRGHTLSWWNSMPPWAAARVAALSAGAAGDMLQTHVHTVVSHWRGRLIQWDVVNEPVDNKGNLVDKLWAPKLGPRYLDLAFEAARAADPDVKLVLNHNLIEQQTNYQIGMRAATLALLEGMVARNVPVQILGIESHIATSDSFSPGEWSRFLDRVTGMGLDIIVTELDVFDRGTIGDVRTRDLAVASLARDYLDLTLSYPQCLGVISWGMVDSDNWLNKMPDHRRSDGAPLRPSPLDANYQPKPLWHAIADAIDRAPGR
jgi:endo-1,4-beta-xylanase